MPKYKMTAVLNNPIRKTMRMFFTIFCLFIIQNLSSVNLTAQTIASSTDKDSTARETRLKDILTGNTPEAKLLIVRKIRFIQNTASLFTSPINDSSLVFDLKPNALPSLFLTPRELHEITPQGADPFGEDIRRRMSDVPPTADLNQLLSSLVKRIQSSRKKISATEIPVPTDLEIDILKELWEHHVMTSSEIYAKLDTLWPVTSEDLSKILEYMANRGFLDRKKISPSHTFGLFGFAQIEMSSKNRKNKLYVYWPILPKEKLITYLDAKRFLAWEAANHRESNGQSNEYYKTLEEKLIRILQ